MVDYSCWQYETRMKPSNGSFVIYEVPKLPLFTQEQCSDFYLRFINLIMHVDVFLISRLACSLWAIAYLKFEDNDLKSLNYISWLMSFGMS